jgi:F0F1-type ATP synthase membrane subunit b/b'
LTDDRYDPFEDSFEEGEFEERLGDSGRVGESDDAETLIRRVIDHVDNARAMPLSASVLVSREEVLSLLHGALERLPDEMRQARWLLKEREEFIQSGKREADELLEDVKVQAERMVQRTEIVRQANQVAQRVVEDAREEARRMRHEAEDFCDKKLASFEIVLERTLKTVVAGREKLQATPPPYPEGSGWRSGGSTQAQPDEDELDEGAGFFDQDER